MDGIEATKQYLQSLIELESENKKQLAELKNLKQVFEQVINYINNNQINDIDNKKLETVLNATFPKEEAKSKLTTFNDAKVFEPFFNNEEIPQIKAVKSFLEKLKKVFENYLISINEKITKLEELLNNKESCHYYLKLFENQNFISKMNPMEFEKFINFLNRNAENKNEIIKVITNFSKDLINEREKQPLTEEFLIEQEPLIEEPVNEQLMVENKEIKQETVETKEIEQVSNLTPEELDQIKKLIEVLNEQLKHTKLTETHQKQVDSYIRLIKDYGQIDRTMIEYLDEPVLLTVILNTLITEYNYYLELEKTKEEYLGSGMETEFTTDMNKTLNKIRTLLDMSVKEKENLVKEEKNNLVVFLPKEDRYYAHDDMDSLTKETLKQVNNSISYLEQISFELLKPEFQKLKSNKTEGIPDYSDEVRPHRMRRGDARVILTRLPVSANNNRVLKDVLEDQYNLTDNFSIVLVIGYGYKDSDNKFYRKMNSRISSEITNIRNIMNLFRHDFEPQTLKEALKLIGDGDDITNQMRAELIKEVTRI